MDDTQPGIKIDPGIRSDMRFLLRMLTRAVFFMAPETPVTAREFCRVMGLRVRSAAQLKPRGLVQTGSGKRAPFQEWLECLEEPAPAARPRGSEPTLSELRRRPR